MNKTLKISTLLMLTISMAACGALDTMDDMSGTTKSMKGTTEEMKLGTEVLLRDARQGGAVKTRRDALDSMMTHKKALELKFKDAAIYYQAFEFQIWENILTDDETHRQALLRDGAQEFLVTLLGVIHGKKPAPNPLSSDDTMTTLLALGATADQVNTIQLEASARKPFQVVSMLDLIATALRSKDAVNNGNIPLEYIYKVLLNEDEALYLLELRYNIMSAMVLDKIYSVSQMGLVDKLKMLLSKKDMVVDLATLNAPEINELTNNYIPGALAMRSLRAELGTPIKLNKNVLKILKKASFKDDPAAGPGKTAAIANFKERFAQLINEPGSDVKK